MTEMNKYILKKSPKTRVLNFFRRLFFTNQPMEKFLIKRIIRSEPNSIWTKFVPPNYLYPLKTIRTGSRDNINYTFDISNFVDHFIYFGYKEGLFDPVKEDILKSKAIFDIGANIGWSAMYFSGLNQEARIYAFEPHPRTFERAQGNFKLNNFPNVSFFQLGLGNKPDAVKLFEVDVHNPGMNRIIPGSQDEFPYVTITIDTIDNFVATQKIERIDFIKIDVEGFEFNVLQGGRKTLQEQRPVLFIELDDNNLRENNSSAFELINLLFSYGYQTIYRADTYVPVSVNTDFTSCHFDIVVKGE